VSRDKLLDEPPPEDVHAAAKGALSREVTDVTRIEKGVNTLFRIDLADGFVAVLKSPRYATDEEFLVEPAVLSRIGRETDVPVPNILASVPSDEGPLDVAYYVMEHVDGRGIDHVPELSPETRARLVREAGEHLAAIQTVRLAESVGHLRAPGGRIVDRAAAGSWPALFEEMVEDVTDAMCGEGPLTDAAPRFADLASDVRDVLAGDDTPIARSSPTPALVTLDYRLANLQLAPEADAASLIRGILDVGGFVGDGLLDAAFTEESLIDVPLGGTAEAESLRGAFRTSYAERCGSDKETVFDERYPYYRLYARARRLKAFDYTSQFARERDEDMLTARWRSFVADRVAEIHQKQ